ncbi:ADP-ribose pyrophosphatase [Halobacteroides halobius DSM 5150]|uniref:ADP-ribose pyrophosphatase n=1 Tax=Halobacteroides halobius (strain ATCC 35273 / DSM 5150 / MD-1) TaxID=748449 RepID=L0K5J0_HALHC|nr:NUDIX hydrolase [Halobacteroides halobius]AGB40552.1 ADP-ribose pyrophosphatase [Halobacteroides halobius DSM 5150]
MDELVEEIIKSTKLYEGRIVTLKLDEVRLPNGNKSSREIVEHDGSVAIIPYQDNKVTLVEQFRAATKEVVLEIPAGKIEINEEVLKCARRELEEETGFRAGSFRKLVQFYTSPGFSNEEITLYLATNLSKYKQQTEADEFLALRKLTIDEVKNRIKAGKFKDAKTIIGLQYLLQWLENNQA